MCDLESGELTTRLSEHVHYLHILGKPGWGTSQKHAKITKILMKINQSQANVARLYFCMNKTGEWILVLFFLTNNKYYCCGIETRRRATK